MKHGDKAKSAKAKASGKEKGTKSGQKAGAKSSKAGQAPKKVAAKAPAQKASAKGGSKAPAKATAKAPAKVAAGNGAARPRPSGGPVVLSFTNPLVASAFKRAVKKFPNAFRKLTD